MNTTTAPDHVVICVAVEETINTHIMYSLQPSFIVVQGCILKPKKYRDRKEIGSKI